MSCNIPDWFWQGYEQLLRWDVSSRLPGSGEEAPFLSQSDITRLLATASAMALEDDPDLRTVAYEVATRTAMMTGSDNPGQLGIAYVILSRLGNFPGRELLQERFPCAAQSISRNQLLNLERIARECENYREFAGGSLLTDFQCDLFDTLQESDSVSVSAPTSAGKSWVLLLDILRRCRTSTAPLIAYIVPTRALIRQVSLDLVEKLDAQGLRNVSVRSVPVPVQSSRVDGGVVYVFTQERLLAFLQSKEESPLLTDLIVDEAQGIRDGSRGIVLQSAIDDALGRFPSLRLVFLSPMSKNPEYLLNLFGRSNRARKLNEIHSPVSQNVIMVSEVERRPRHISVSLLQARHTLDLGIRELPFSFRGKTDRLAAFASAISKPGDSTIIYVDSPANTEKVAARLVPFCPVKEPLDEEVEEFSSFLSTHIHGEYSLIQYLPHGAAYHYGNMPSVVRAGVEGLFRKGKLGFICCTSTLLQGVNLPARHVVLDNPHQGRGAPMDRQGFLNLAGRAGRLLKEFQGNVWCLQPNAWSEKSFEGASQVEIEAAFESEIVRNSKEILACFLDDGGAATNDSASVAAASRIYSEFTRNGESISQSVYAGDSNVETLAAIDVAAAKYANSNLPQALFRRNATIIPSRLIELYSMICEENCPLEWIPLSPNQKGSNERMSRIFRIVFQVLERRNDDQYKFYSYLAADWIHETTLRTMIENRISYQRKKGRFQSVEHSISSLMNNIESDIRFTLVKYTRAYIDVLSEVLMERGYVNEAAQIPPLPLFLECGASQPVTLSLISMGMSRLTALLLGRLLSFPQDASPETCIEVLRASNLEKFDLPKICRNEIAVLSRKV